MKHFKLTLFILLTVVGMGFAQSKIPSSIFIIDAQSNTLVPANTDAANLFKTALVELVVNTPTAKTAAVANFGPGRRSIVITQADPQANGDAYQLVLQRAFMGTNTTVYTFMYNVDQNKLYYYDTGSGNWLDEDIKGTNVLNLNNCQAYGAFNNLGGAPEQAAAPDNNQAAPADQQQADNTDNADYSEPDTSVSVPAQPPALPDYEQPECPTDGYLWQPGYWAYSMNTNGYYWVPGVWVAPPTVGYLWTPPYWGFAGGFYRFHAGYWGPSIGFYGGIDYGYGYGGVGFAGGEWREGHFRYNTAIVRVQIGFRYTYVDRTVYRERGPNRYSFNGRGGYMARPNPHEVAAMRESHIMATHEQIRNQQAARADRSQFASNNGGRPGNLAAAKAPERVPNNNNGGRMNGGPGANGNRNGGSPANQGGNRPATDAINRPGNPQGQNTNGGGRPGTITNTPANRPQGTNGNQGGTRPAGASGFGGGNRPAGRPSGPPSGLPGSDGSRTGFGSGNRGKTNTKLPKTNNDKKRQ